MSATIKYSFLWVLLLIPAISQVLVAQSGVHPPVLGSPVIRNYPPKEYRAHNQNWTIVQDDRGMMYFGNRHGVLEYDGVSWHTIVTGKEEIIRSLVKGSDGRIYAGSFDDLGYLAPDSINQLRFVSLMEHVAQEFLGFGDVWQTLSIGDDICFVTAKCILRWNGKEMRGWKPRNTFHVGFDVNDQLYVNQPQVGMMRLNGDSLTLIPLGEQFANERVMTVLPLIWGDSKRLVLGTRNNGLLLYDGVSITPFESEANDMLRESQIYCGALLEDGMLAFGTLQNGVIIIDTSGHLLYHLNKSTGLQDETIWYVYQDKQGGLWMGMHLGIARAEIGYPHTHFASHEGIEGSVLDIIRHKGRLYATSSIGTYYLDESPDARHAPGRFLPVTGVSPQGWALLSHGDKLLVATFDGVYEVEGDKGKLINQTYAMALVGSRKDPNRVFVGKQRGIKSLYYNGSQWIDEGQFEGLEYEIHPMFEAPDGTLWITARGKGLIAVDFTHQFSMRPSFVIYDTLHGLPAIDHNTVFMTSKGLRVGTARGIYLFDENAKRFLRDTTLIPGMRQDMTIFSVSTDKSGIWVAGVNEGGLASLRTDGRYTWDQAPFSRIAHLDSYLAYPDPMSESVAWLGCLDRVIRYDRNAIRRDTASFKTFIRQVVADGDSLVYGGAGWQSENEPRLSYANKLLRFHFAAPTFDDASHTEFQYFLEGYDQEWSSWSSETYKDYTRLGHGSYRFLVKSRNIYDTIGETAEFRFRILPPFYLTIWAYIGYAAIIVLILYVFRLFEIKRVQQKHQRELAQLEYTKLKELDQLKSRFFADISHEFRTPLTLILGPVDKLLASKPGAEQANQYQVIRRNAQRLLRLINQLLDLSKLDAGKMKLELVYQDIIPVIKGIVHSFESLVLDKKVRLSMHTNVPEAILNIDRDKIEQILFNLISNAVKFTPEHGEIDVHVIKTPGNRLQINVDNTGPGISTHQLPHVFDRFYQGDEASRIAEPGSGIGLALAKELVLLHHGTIQVTSTEGQRTSFSIELPYPKEAATARPLKEIRTENVFTHSELSQQAANYTGFSETSLSEHTLLLVEDNADMRAFIRDTLEKEYQIIEAVDGNDGVEKAFQAIPDIIVSDVMMPGKDGLQFCDIIKKDERTSHIPVILLTAKADIESRIAGLERGADEYLAKPFHREELLVRARNLLSVRSKLRERYGSLQPLPPTSDKNLQVEDAFLLKVRTLVEDHMADAEFEIDNLAKMLSMSRSQLFRKLKAVTGQSPSLFIRGIRLRKAKELLESTEMNVNEVAYTVGFSAPGYFSDAFAETYGIRPSQVRKMTSL